jgi:enediyne biosynthesis protein E4
VTDRGGARVNRSIGRRVAAALVVVVAVAGVAVAGSTVLRGGTAPGGPAAPRFVEEASAAGIDHTFGGEDRWYVGGGVALFDCDDDHRPDLYLAGGAGPALLARNASPVGGSLNFTPVHDPATDLPDVTGAYPLDIDGDAVSDLAILRRGETVLLRGLGDCRFERANETWSFDGGDAWTTAFSATWEGASTLPTLALGRYLDLERTTNSTRICDDNELIRPAADGTFGPATPLRPGFCTLSILLSDWDRSGRRDLRISNDRHFYRDGREQLWRIEPGQPPREYAERDGWEHVQIWGMGIASQDLTGDRYPEVYLTSQGDNKLQTLADGPAQPRYRDIALERGATAHRPFAGDTTLPSTAWHPQFEDVNNDGTTDLFVTKGNVTEMPDYARRDPSNLLLGQAEGTFVEGAEEAGIVNFDRGRGAAVADLNLDGLLDLVQVNFGAPVRIWRSTGSGASDNPAMGHWLGVQLSEPGANRDAIGSWIEVRAGDTTIEREVTVGGGHVSGRLGPTHFGLGAADRAEVRVTWPDGEQGPWMPVAADQYVTLDRGTGDAAPWSLP